MNTDIRKYINLIETAQEANIGKIARLINITNNKMEFGDFRILAGKIVLKNPTADISIYGIPIKINEVIIYYRHYGMTDKSIEFTLDYIARDELKTKIKNAAKNDSTARYFHDIIHEYIEYTGKNQVTRFIKKLNIGFSTNAILDLTRYKLFIESLEDDDSGECAIGIKLSVSDSQLIKEFEKALRYKISMDELS